MAKDLDARVDELYDLPPDSFVAARDALAKELSGDERKAVKALRRPSVAAGLANRLARAQPGALRDLFDAGEGLREAQLGRGGGDVRAAVARERKAVDALIKSARGLDGATAPTLDRLRVLLHAAAGDDELRAALERGRVEREPQAGGGWPALDLAAEETAPSTKPARQPRGAAKPRATAPSRPEAKSRAEHEKRAAKEQAEAAERQRLLAAAQRRHRERAEAGARAEKDAGRAQTRLERATAATAKAQEALADAEATEREALADAQRALRALKTAQAQLQEAQDDLRALGG